MVDGRTQHFWLVRLCFGCLQMEGLPPVNIFTSNCLG